MFQSELSFAVPVLTEALSVSISSLEVFLEEEYVLIDVCEDDSGVTVGVGDTGEVGLQVDVVSVSMGDTGEGR